MALARTLMVQGTASSVGKSLLVTGLCRYFARQGLRVAPFKGLNMALNAHVTSGGFEIARAQAVQAEAAGIEPIVEMNPVLLKPEGNARSQVVLLGKSVGVHSARELFSTGIDVKGAVLGALEAVRSQYDLVVIEGAGSPAEINLRARDVANMFIARAADAPVLLAGDIDRGGVLAAFVGTLALLEPEDRARVAALWVNKFRGDLSLLTPGLDWLTEHTNKPIFGVLPHLGRLCIAEEDSLNVDARLGATARAGAQQIEICVLRLPRISNHDEFQPFEHEPDVTLTFSEDPERALSADLVIVPGTKSTVSDLAWLRERGLDHVLFLRARLRRPVLGICGGCQLLGQRIADPHGVESAARESEGLGLLPLSTEFRREKRTRRVLAQSLARGVLFAELEGALRVPGYFIHAGITAAEGAPLFEVEEDGLRKADGSADASGMVMGTMIHGLFEHDALRHSALDQLRKLRGLTLASHRARWDRQADYDRLADAIATHCDIALLRQLVAI
jgi:adenosylcobyric acid synthase